MRPQTLSVALYSSCRSAGDISGPQAGQAGQAGWQAGQAGQAVMLGANADTTGPSYQENRLAHREFDSVAAAYGEFPPDPPVIPGLAVLVVWGRCERGRTTVSVPKSAAAAGAAAVREVCSSALAAVEELVSPWSLSGDALRA